MNVRGYEQTLWSLDEDVIQRGTSAIMSWLLDMHLLATIILSYLNFSPTNAQETYHFSVDNGRG